jgi:lipopolysaccharide export system protein LptA
MNAPLLLLLALAAPAAAPPSKAAAARSVPAHVDADVIRYSWSTRKVTMLGKPFVTLTREDLTLTCRKLVGDNDVSGQLARATCEGDVKLVRGTRTVTCERAQYDRDAARIICEGNPVLRDGETEARGKRLTYLLAADEVLLEEAVQATVPSGQIDPLGKKPTPGPPWNGKPSPTPATIGPARPAPPVKPAGGGK